MGLGFEGSGLGYWGFRALGFGVLFYFIFFFSGLGFMIEVEEYLCVNLGVAHRHVMPTDHPCSVSYALLSSHISYLGPAGDPGISEDLLNPRPENPNPKPLNH